MQDEATKLPRANSPSHTLDTWENPFEELDGGPSYDGTDERQLDGNGSSRRSGIVTDAAGVRQFVPRSVRPSGSTRPEISIRPGYVPPEDRAVYKNRRVIGGIPQYESEDMTSSSAGSKNSSVIQSPASATAEIRSQGSPENGPPSTATARSLHIDPDFETTTEWYGKLKKNGQGWEHIYVAGWEACFKSLKIGVK
jgi:hypothetical protein